MAFDEVRGRVVLYGGTGLRGEGELSDTWEWNGANWVLVATGGDAPPSRVRLTYDGQRQRVVAYERASFEWDGRQWTKTAEPGPDATMVGLTFDAERDSVVTFGGQTASGRGLSSATWERVASQWFERTATPHPAGRVGVLVFDRARREVLLFGGATPSGSLSDTWTWDGKGWREVVVSPSPSARAFQVAVWDPDRELVVLFSGVSDSQQTALDDVWVWNGSTWTQELPVGAHPGEAAGKSLVWTGAYDSMRHELVVFGSGPSASTRVPQTWIYR